MGVVEDLHRARRTYERQEWVAAYRALSDLDEGELSASDFTALATTAHLLGRRDDCVQALQRAYQVGLAAGDRRAASLAAYWLTVWLWQSGELAVGNGWLARTARLLGDDQDVAEHGYLCHARMMAHVLAGELAEALGLAPRITEYGRRFAEADLLALGLNSEGRLLLYAGQVAEGLRRMDEAMAGVMAGEVGPVIAGQVYCTTIEGCQEVSDLGRAGQWTRALTTWCDNQPGLVAFTGQCAVHRGQLLRLHGAYTDAVEELERAVERYRRFGGDPAVGQAHYERGETHRLRGDVAAAQAAFATAGEHGHPAQPGRAMLWLAQGDTAAAAAAARRLLAEHQDPVHRCQVLPAAVEILVADGDVEAAAAHGEELCLIGNTFGCSALQASGRYAASLVALARNDTESALQDARRAVDGWSRLSAPYETARSRALVGRALRLLGDEGSAVAELTVARQVLAGLGARPAEQDVAALLGDPRTPGGLSAREVEVLRLVAAGRSNRAIAAELTLSEKTVARHLSNIFTKLDVDSRTAAAAFAFDHRLV